MPDVTEILCDGAARIDAALERLLPSAETGPVSIHRAMRHSVFAGGKRLRPILCMEAARMIAGNLPAGIEDLGSALEMLHTYSLIHDDLPALDNDDLRRGKPTCHVVFGEDIAILAGDALQTQAYEVLSELKCSPERAIAIVGDGPGRGECNSNCANGGEYSSRKDRRADYGQHRQWRNLRGCISTAN
jgi:geranylgeranyl diphosphate synthase type II